MVYGIRDTDDFSRRRSGGGRFVGREYNQQHDFNEPNTGDAYVDVFDPSAMPSGTVVEIDDTSGNPDKKAFFSNRTGDRNILETPDDVPESLFVSTENPLASNDPASRLFSGNRDVQFNTPDLSVRNTPPTQATRIGTDGAKSSVSNDILSRFFSGQIQGLQPSGDLGGKTNISSGSGQSVGNISRNINILKNPLGLLQKKYPDARLPKDQPEPVKQAVKPTATQQLKEFMDKSQKKSAQKTRRSGDKPQLPVFQILRELIKTSQQQQAKLQEKTTPVAQKKPSKKPPVAPLKMPNPKDLGGHTLVSPEPDFGSKRPKNLIKIPLYTFGNTPEVGGNPPEYLMKAFKSLGNTTEDLTVLPEKNPELIKIEEDNIKKSLAVDKRSLIIDYQGRINDLKDPEMDPLSPSYNFGKFFNDFIVGKRMSRLVTRENWENGYPYDIRRSILRNPLTDSNIIVWQNGVGVQKLDPKLVLEFKKNLEDNAIEPYALRKGIYVPDEKDELTKDDTKQIFDLMHISDNLVANHYTDLDKQREYLQSGKPMDSNYREMLSKVDRMMENMTKNTQQAPLSSTPVESHEKFKALKQGVIADPVPNNREIFEKFQKMIWQKNLGAKNNPELNMLSDKFSPRKDLAKVLIKTQPRNETAPFEVLSQELAETNHFMGDFMGKDDFGDRMLSDMLGRPTRESDLPASMGKSWVSGMLDKNTPLYNRGRQKKQTTGSYNILTGEKEFI